MRLILASASPRRIELIKKLAYLDVTVMPSGAEEITDKTAPDAAVVDLASLKARAVAAKCGGLVLGADTVVALGGRTLGKPRSEEEAFGFFRFLCGRTHSVFTGVCLTDGTKTVTGCAETRVAFAPYDAAVVTDYVRSGKPFDKAGGYGLQDEELKELIEGITGDYDNVLGLPVGLVDRLIRENFI